MIRESITVKSAMDVILGYCTANNYKLVPDGASYDPAVRETYFTDKFLTNDDISVGLESTSSDYTKPIYQINVFVPINNSRGITLRLAEDVKALYPKTTMLTLNSTTQRAQVQSVDISDMMLTSSHYWVAVSVNLTVIASNT